MAEVCPDCGRPFTEDWWRGAPAADDAAHCSPWRRGDAMGLRGCARHTIQRLRAQLAEALSQVPRWIACEQQMPPEGSRVLLVATEGGVHIGVYNAECGAFPDSAFTAWMPLPSPPETK